MGFYIDLGSITIDQYKEKLKKKNLTPSRMVLKEKIEERFSCFKSLGIKDVLELQQKLKSKEGYAQLTKSNCLSENYLNVLVRELKSVQPKPNKLNDFAGISDDTVSKLEKYGIKNTAKLYDKVIKKEDRKEIAVETGISEKDILEITKLTDLSRIQWVNPTFARVLYESGYDTSQKVAEADYEELYNSVKRINEERKLYKGSIGLNDMKICVEAAHEVPKDIEY